jgi:hypothetical protein
VDQSDAQTINYQKFHKTALVYCESEETVSRFQEDQEKTGPYQVKIDVINELVNDIAAKGKSSHIPKALAALLQEQPTSALETTAPTVDLVT